MGALSFALVVFFAIVWPSQQLLTEPDACSVLVNPLTRPKCGGDNISRDQCIGMGCCFSESKSSTCGGKSSGTCYLPVNCEDGPNMYRSEMGWKLISRQACNCRGGCFDNSDPAKVQCFKPHPDNLCKMRVFENALVARHEYRTIRKITAKQCEEACANEPNGKCKSADYQIDIGRCYLSMKTYEEAKKEHLLRTNSNFKLFAVCASAVTPPPVVVDDICEYTAYDGTVIGGQSNFGSLKQTMSLQECQAECNKAGAQCKGFEYNRRRQRCYLSTITFAEGVNRKLIRQIDEWITYSCPYTGPPLTTPAPPPPPTEPPIITNETLPECISKAVDLIFVLDESSSIVPDDFEKAKDFLKGITKKLPIAKNQTQIGLITYSSSPVTHFHLTGGRTSSRVVNNLKRLSQRGGNTYTHTAIDLMVKMMTTKHLSGGRNPVSQVAVVLTDGASKYPARTKNSSRIAHEAGIKVITVGVGNYDHQEVNDIASKPEYVFTVKQFDELLSLIQDISIATCEGAPSTPDEVDEDDKKPSYDPYSVPRYCKDIPVANRTNKYPIYLIDPDGPLNGANPFKVECDFSGNPPISILHTYNEQKTCFKECEERKEGCHVQTIGYHTSIYATNKFVKLAQSCEMPINFDCYKTAIDYRTHDPKGPYTYLTNYQGQKMNYWPGGSVANGGCACGKTGTCFLKSERCQCDARDDQWRSDSGVLTDQHTLPIKDIAIGDISEKGQEACFTAGPLRCV